MSDPSTLQTTDSAVGFRTCEILHSSFKNGISISYSTLAHLSENSDVFKAQLLRISFLVKNSSWTDPQFSGRNYYLKTKHMYTCGGFILIFGKSNTVM